MIFRVRVVCAAALFAGLVWGCESKGFETLSREELFFIRIGKMEDEIDLFQFAETASSQKTSLFVRDGNFYVSSGSSGKVMEFTSHGDILSMYYNPDKNPRPVMLQDASAGEGAANRKAYPYSFVQLGEVAVSAGRMVYIEDRLPDERAVEDEELGVKLNKIVLRFRNGEYQGYLGQEGMGGLPFPYIQSVHVTEADEVVVVCRTLRDWRAFWFSASGERLDMITIALDGLPFPEGEGYFANIETIFPARGERVLFVKVDYYREGRDGVTGVKSGIEDAVSRIYRLNAASSSFEGFTDVPQNVRRERGTDVFEMQNMRYSYEFIGVDTEGNFFLKSREEGNVHQLLVLAKTGQAVWRRNLSVEDSQLLFSVFTVSQEGILAGLLASETGARAVWWRSDTLRGGL